ncbi:hypothetical protein ACFQZU_20615, partial [Streptomonospora algeriensis]
HPEGGEAAGGRLRGRAQRHRPPFTVNRRGRHMWPVVGLAFGVVLGLAGAFGGFGAFALVFVLGAIGFLGGRAFEGEIDLAELFTRRE